MLHPQKHLLDGCPEDQSLGKSGDVEWHQALAGFIVTNVLLAFVNIPLQFILIRFAEGMLISGMMLAALSMVGDTIPRSKQGRWIGFLTTAQAVGFAIGPGSLFPVEESSACRKCVKLGAEQCDADLSGRHRVYNGYVPYPFAKSDLREYLPEALAAC